MTVSSSTAQTGPLAGDGTTTKFAFSVQMTSAADVRVVLTTQSSGLYADEDLIANTDYTVDLNADQDDTPGGTITCTTAPLTGESITILRNIEPTQGASIPNQSAFYPKVLEAALDKLTMLVQQLQTDVNRAYRSPYGDVSGSTITDLVNTVSIAVSDALTAASNAEGVAAAAIAAAEALDLGNVDNTSDLDKPVSTATQTALDLKANAANPAFTGTADFNNGSLTEIKTATFNSQPALTTTTGAVTVDWAAAQNYKQNEPTGNITYTFNAPLGPCHLQLFIDSDGTTTSRTFTWPAAVIWLGTQWTHTANKKAVINFWYDGTKYYAMGVSQV